MLDNQRVQHAKSHRELVLLCECQGKKHLYLVFSPSALRAILQLREAPQLLAGFLQATESCIHLSAKSVIRRIAPVS